MCFHGESPSSSSSVSEAVEITFRPKGGEARRRFGQSNNLVYLVAAVGPIRYINPSVTTQSEAESGEYTSDEYFQRDVNNGRLVEIDREAPPAKPVDTRTDRLKAAEEDTGFSLGEKVLKIGSFSEGVVTGFARVDEDDNKGIRKVVVTYKKTVTELFDADDLI